MAAAVETFALPGIPADWAGENNFRPLGKLSPATQRNIEPVGAHFLAEARRVRAITLWIISRRLQVHLFAKWEWNALS